MNKIIISMVLALCFNSQGYSDAVIPIGDFSKKLQKAAGEQGKFVGGKDNFPKSYFLIHQNLPYLAGLSLHHPKSSTLGLSQNQIKMIEDVKKRTVPLVVKKAQEIKKLELKLANNIAIDSNSAQSQYDLVTKISKLRTELTKAHLQCINDIRAILTKEQYKKLLAYATKLAVKPKSNKFRIDELVLLPHPAKYIKMGQIKASKEQKMLISKDVKKKLAPIFQDKIREAYTLEKKVQRMVSKGESKESVKPLLDQIMKLKREAIDTRIDALYKIKNILTKEQWNKVNKLTYK